LNVNHRFYQFIDALMRDRNHGVEDVFVVTHGVTLRTLAMAFLKIDPKYYPDFKNPQNCSLYLIEGDEKNRYSFMQIYNGETKMPVAIDWGKKLHAYEPAYLPPYAPKGGGNALPADAPKPL
jgi:broad specificity phosphatase PhoE